MNETPGAARVLDDGARLALLVNPTARGHDRRTIDAVVGRLRSRFEVDVIVPPSAEDVERTVRASSATHDAIVVAGGDGTIHRAVCGLDGAATPLGVIPMGTGNDFARGSGFRRRRARRRAAFWVAARAVSTWPASTAASTARWA